MRLLARFVGSVLTLGLIGIAGVVGYRTYYPCNQPIAYSIGPVDERFDLTTEEFRHHVRDAIHIWEAAAGRPLFREQASGGIAVRAVFDHRQEAVKQLTKLGVTLDQGQQSHEEVKKEYDTLKARYDKRMEAYEKKRVAFEARKNAFEARIDDPVDTKEEYDALEAERNAINAQIPILEKEFRELERRRAELNAVVGILNRMAATHNESAEAYRGIGESVGEEFEAGLYERRGGLERITIYSFGGPQELRSLLAHELGHALGLPHIDVPGTVMYRLNESTVRALAPEDVIALKARCRME